MNIKTSTSKKSKTKKILVGGAVNYVLKTTVEATGPHNLGKGYKGYLVTAPKCDIAGYRYKTGRHNNCTLMPQ